MRLRYIVSAPHRHGREARKPAAGTFTGLPHTHMHAHTPSTPPHTCTNGNSLNVGVAHTNMHIYTHTHTHSSRTLAHLQSCIIKPIKEMSLISRGVSALVHHWGFLAGAGDMQSSSSSLWDLSHHALIRHSSKLYWDSWFSRAGLAHKSIQSSSGHLWMRFKGFENESGENVGLAWHTASVFCPPPSSIPSHWKTCNLVSSSCRENLYYPHRRAQAHWDEWKWLHNNGVKWGEKV